MLDNFEICQPFATSVSCASLLNRNNTHNYIFQVFLSQWVFFSKICIMLTYENLILTFDLRNISRKIATFLVVQANVA